MTESHEPGPEKKTAAPSRTLITAKSEYLKGADTLLELAQLELRIFDRDLSETRLDAPVRIEAMRRFLARSRLNRIHIALHDVEHVKRFCPRIIALLGAFADSMSIRRTEGEASRAQDCFMLADRVHVVRRPVALQGRGVLILNDRHEGQAMRDRFDEIWESSEPGVSANTTGL